MQHCQNRVWWIFFNKSTPMQSETEKSRRACEVTRVHVAMFTVTQHVSGSIRKHASSSRKPTERKRLKGALVSVASKNWFTVFNAVLHEKLLPVCCVVLSQCHSEIICSFLKTKCLHPIAFFCLYPLWMFVILINMTS